MTPTEVLTEIEKMPSDQKRKVLREITEQLDAQTPHGLNAKERNFINGLRQKGLLNEMPRRLPPNKSRLNFKRINITGEPLSETIIRERG